MQKSEKYKKKIRKLRVKLGRAASKKVREIQHAFSAKEVETSGFSAKEVEIPDFINEVSRANILALIRDEFRQMRSEEDAQKLTDKAIKEIDAVAAAKEKEIMEV